MFGLFDRWFGPPTPAKFAGLFIEALRRAGDDAPVEFDAAEFRLRHVGRAGYTNLRNFYDEYVRAPRSQRRELLQRSVTATVASRMELPEDFEDCKPDLRPRLWCKSTIEKLRLEAELEGNQGPDLPLQDVGAHLYATVVYDLPMAVRSISMEDLKTWGVTPYEAVEAARDNLKEDKFAFAAIGDGFYASLTGDTYDASRMLLVDLIRNLKVDGDPVVMAPNRDKLLVTGADDDTGLEMMVTIAEQAADEPRSMMLMPLRLDGDEWVDWSVPRAHALWKRFHFLELKFLSQEYAEQKSLLDRLHEKTGVDIYVAAHSAVRKDDGDVFSYCVWSDGVDALLPQADFVMFFRQGEDVVGSADWASVRRICDSLMEETDMYPARFRVRSFPTAEQLKQIGKNDP